MRDPAAPAEFQRAVDEVRRAEFREELTINEIPSPTGVAPWSIALSANFGAPPHGQDSALGTGRFILMYDPEEPSGWDGAFRVVTFVQATQDADIARDELAAPVAWTWVTEALALRHADASALAGTVTSVASSSFGDIEHRSDTGQMELRASWSPHGSVTAHVEAWCDIVCAVAGHSVHPGAATLDQARTARG